MTAQIIILQSRSHGKHSEPSIEWLRHILPRRDFDDVCQYADKWNYQPVDVAAAMIGRYLEAGNRP